MAKTTLVKLEQIKHDIALITKPQEAKELADKAEAIRVWAQKSNQSHEIQNLAAETKLRAERQGGLCLLDMEKRGELKTKAGPKGSSAQAAQITISELGLEHTEATRWRRLAEMVQGVFEGYFSDKASEFTRADLLRLGRQTKQKRDHAAKVRKARETPLLDDGSPCGIVLADPPWRYEHAKTKSRQIENQYPTMELGEICHLGAPLAKRLLDDVVLFLWVTAPKLVEAIDVLQAWEFEYRTCAVWDKGKIGMGYWFRQQHELLLVGTRGKPVTPPAPVRRSSVFRASRGKHSKKPNAVYEYIEAAYPDTPKLEMFQRGKARPGWQTWGAESE